MVPSPELHAAPPKQTGSGEVDLLSVVAMQSVAVACLPETTLVAESAAMQCHDFAGQAHAGHQVGDDQHTVGLEKQHVAARQAHRRDTTDPGIDTPFESAEKAEDNGGIEGNLKLEVGAVADTRGVHNNHAQQQMPLPLERPWTLEGRSCAETEEIVPVLGCMASMKG